MEASEELVSRDLSSISISPAELPEALGGSSLVGLKGSCPTQGCTSINCLDQCAQTLAAVLGGGGASLCHITEGQCTCQAGFGDPGSAVFSDPSENKGPVCHAALYRERNMSSDRQWWNQYFDHQLLGPTNGAGFMNKEIFSPLYGSFIVASVMTALDTANQRGHTDVASRATQWLKAYWALSAIASRPGNIQAAYARVRPDLRSVPNNSSYINGATQVSAGPRTLSFPGSAVGSTLHPLLTMALDISPKVYQRGLNVNFAYYGGVRAAAELAGFQFDSNFNITNFNGFTAPASVFGLTNAERANLAAVVRGQSSANLPALVQMVGNYKPKCNLSFLRTTQGSISWFGTSEAGAAGRQGICNRAKGPIFAMSFATIGGTRTAHYLQPALESTVPSAAQWVSYRQGNQICADVDPTFAKNSSDATYRLGPWCIDIPGGNVLYEYSWTRTGGLQLVTGSGGGNAGPEIAVQADFVGPISPGGTLNFGTVPPQAGTYIEKVIRVTNDGDEAMTLSASTTNTSGFAFSQIGQPASPAAAGSNSSVFRIRLSRDSTGSFAATVGITHDAENTSSPFTFTVIGEVATTPETLVLNPDADAYVAEENPTGNFGSSTVLRIRSQHSVLGRRSLLRFQIPAGVTNVISAELRLHSRPAVVEEAGFYRLEGSSWTESGVNWANHLDPPAQYFYLYSRTNLAANSWYGFDVTSSVTGAGPVTFGIGSSSDLGGQGFDSRESAHAPQLIITYQP